MAKALKWNQNMDFLKHADNKEQANIRQQRKIFSAESTCRGHISYIKLDGTGENSYREVALITARLPILLMFRPIELFFGLSSQRPNQICQEMKSIGELRRKEKLFLTG